MSLDEIFNALRRPFPASQISWRVGATSKDKKKGIALAYIDARDVMGRFDEVLGLNWQCKYTHAGQKTICDIGILDEESDRWIWRAGGAGDTDIEAEKGAISDAFKRAAVLFGVGRYLYSLPNVWVPIDDFKRLVEVPSLPKWATPEGFDSKQATPPVATPPEQYDDIPIETLQEIVMYLIDCHKAGKDMDAVKCWYEPQTFEEKEGYGTAQEARKWVWGHLREHSKLRTAINNNNPHAPKKEAA
jgi:hypothetical protein